MSATAPPASPAPPAPPAPIAPAALTVRPATAADYPCFSRFFQELGTGDPVPPPERWTETMAPATVFFDEPAGRAVAYAYVQVLSGTGYVRHIVVDPDQRGRGVGRAVMAGVASRLVEAGCGRWCLNVKPDNTAAIRLYTSVGMAPAHLSTAFRFGWDLVPRLPRGARPMPERSVTPADDAAIEATFAMPAGQIAETRRNARNVLLSLVDPHREGTPPLAFASFDPHFPGAFPFRVLDPTLAAPLLDAIHPHALPDPPYMQIVSEDAALTAALAAAGATVRLEILHMRGKLPLPGA
ncbi:GNAT family N-acetyltransferase [Chondromyces apiculatus]|uniref:Acetyltransferase, GNAT family n=1 Tax=Chondromyces apiculatus DSM 436 TaxID=1192034 RepID=A0A017TBC9_9BACT|nr:GNAT family N-acetyltransferase [Chondromyces apiculatus]EYF06232.1 acetyltransferase, GNAT family [Chondromyces apiculatus DSM 436]